jgi:hypothetical protein
LLYSTIPVALDTGEVVFTTNRFFQIALGQDAGLGAGILHRRDTNIRRAGALGMGESFKAKGCGIGISVLSEDGSSPETIGAIAGDIMRAMGLTLTLSSEQEQILGPAELMMAPAMGYPKAGCLSSPRLRFPRVSPSAWTSTLPTP